MATSQKRVILLHQNGLAQIVGLFDPNSMELRQIVPSRVEGEPSTVLYGVTLRAIVYKEVFFPCLVSTTIP